MFYKSKHHKKLKLYRKRCASPLHAKNGFVLIEAVIAMSIISFGLLALISLQTMAIKGNRIALNRMNAVMLARTNLEKSIALDFSLISTLHNNTETHQIGNVIFNIKKTVTESTNNSKLVNINVSWHNKSIDLNSLISLSTGGR